MNGETLLTFAADHSVFAGHFPGRPIVPGVLLLDAALHALAQAALAADPGPAPGPQTVWLIASAKFLSPVQPGETLRLCLDSTSPGSTRFSITGDGRKVASGTFVAGAGA